MIIGVFITWIVGKFAILFLVLLVGGAITSFLPDTEKNLIFIVEGLPKLFFNIGGIGGFQLFPGGMIEVSIMLLLAVIGAVGATINPD